MGRRSKVNYSKGTVFLFPLKGGGYARGVVARMDGKGLVFGYFFGPKLQSPEEASPRGLAPSHAVLIGKFGDLSLINNEWSQLGLVEKWNPDEWPVPPLIRVDEFTGKGTLSYYDDNTFECIDQEEVSSSLLDQYPYDRTMGAGAVEIRLSMLLNDK